MGGMMPDPLARDDVLKTWVLVLATLFARVLQSAFAPGRGRTRPSKRRTLAILKKRTQGRPGARCTRDLVCKYVHQETHTSIQVQRRQSGLPCAMVLRLISRSPR